MLNTLPGQAKAFTAWKKLDTGTTITQDNLEAKTVHRNGDFGQDHIVRNCDRPGYKNW